MSLASDYKRFQQMRDPRWQHRRAIAAHKRAVAEFLKINAAYREGKVSQKRWQDAFDRTWYWFELAFKAAEDNR